MAAVVDLSVEPEVKLVEVRLLDYIHQFTEREVFIHGKVELFRCSCGAKEKLDG